MNRARFFLLMKPIDRNDFVQLLLIVRNEVASKYDFDHFFVRKKQDRHQKMANSFKQFVFVEKHK